MARRVVKFQDGLFDELSLYARQDAWLNATPERPKDDTSGAPLLSRLERMRKSRDDQSYRPEMPEMDAGGHIIEYLFEIGPAMPGGMGPAPITHQEIACWQELTGIDLQAWEARILRRLSREYVTELHLAAKPNRPAPWQAEGDVPDLSAVASGLRHAIASMA